MNIAEVSSSTYSLSTIESLVECNTILLFNSSYLKDVKLSVDNLEVIYNSIINDSSTYIPYLTVEKESSDSGFYYELSNATKSGVKTGFNEIIYVNKGKSVPLGYTELQTQIGVSTNVIIKINLTTDLDKGSDLSVSFKMDSVTESLYSLKKLNGDNLYEYTTVSSINNSPKVKFEPYTNNITCLLQDSNKTIFLNDRIITSDFKLHKLGLLENKEVDPFRNNFQTYKVSRYGTDLAVYAWSKTKVGDKYQIDYCINSLTICNKFNNLLQYVHTKDNDGCCTIPDIIEDGKTAIDIDVLYVTGKYIVCKGIFEDGSSIVKVFNTDSEEPYWVHLPSDFICLSEWDTIPEVIRLVNKKINFSIDSIREVLEKYPDLYTTYLDTRNLSSFYLIRKIGEWYLLQKSINSGTVFVLAGKYSTVYLTNEDLERLIVVNNNTIIIKNDNYYTMYTGQKYTWYTERYRAFFYDSSTVDYNGIDLANIGDNVSSDISDTTYKNYYDKEIIKVIRKTDQISDTILDRYRRNKYPTNLDKIPDIIDSCDGIIFYIEDGKINYL